MDHDLTGRIAIVVGGGQTPGEQIGNGRATSIMLARHGAEVVVAARHLDRAQTTVDMISKEGGKGWAYEMDSSKKEECQRLIDDVIEKYGRLDILVYNAGINPKYDSIQNVMSDEEFNKCMDVNLLGAMYCNMFAASAMQEKNIRGVIVNVSSIASIQNRTGLSVGLCTYAFSKSGLNHLTEFVAVKYADYGIRANTLILGPVATVLGETETQHLLGDVSLEKAKEAHNDAIRLKGAKGTAWDAANAILFLVSDESQFITGQDLVVDGGATMVR